jgi:hypothetical protein
MRFEFIKHSPAGKTAHGAPGYFFSAAGNQSHFFIGGLHHFSS